MQPHPNFLVMVGNRYGWVPLPYIIEAKEFEKISHYITDNNSDVKFESSSITRITTKSELLNQWYKLDENQLPASYILQPRIKEYIQYANWEVTETLLRVMLQEAANNIDI
jgi:hypothetical protein